MISTKGMTIKEIVSVSIRGNLLCKLEANLYALGKVDYWCNKSGEQVYMTYRSVHNKDLRHVGRIVWAYEEMIDGENPINGWHGDFTDGEEPQKGELCYILVEHKKKSYCRRYDVEIACYDGRTGFYGYINSDDFDVLGFKHISKNGKPY